MSAEATKVRGEIPVSDQWNIEALYPSFEAWKADFESTRGAHTSPHWPELQQGRGRLKENIEILKGALDTSFDLSRKLDKLYTYAHLRHDEEITIDRYKEAFQRISALLYDFQQECAWIEPEILELPNECVEQYLRSPILAEYRYHLEKIFRMRPHTLTADKEELLAMAGKTMQTAPKAFSALNNADLKLGKVCDQTGRELELTHALYQLYLSLSRSCAARKCL